MRSRNGNTRGAYIPKTVEAVASHDKGRLISVGEKLFRGMKEETKPYLEGKSVMIQAVILILEALPDATNNEVLEIMRAIREKVNNESNKER